MTTETPSALHLNRYTGAPIVYRDADVIFALRPSDWRGREADAVHRLLAEWSLAAGVADETEFPSASSLANTASVVLDDLVSIVAADRIHRFDGRCFSVVEDEADLLPVVGFQHRMARLGPNAQEIFLVLSPEGPPVFVDRCVFTPGARVRVADTGLHVVDDPFSVQAACAMEGALSSGFVATSDDPLLAHIAVGEDRLRSESSRCRSACIDFECLQAIRGGLLDGAPRGAFLPVVFTAWQALDAIVSRDIGVFRVAEALDVPISRFLPGSAEDHRDWLAWSRDMGVRSFPVSGGLCLQGDRGTPAESSIRAAVRDHPSVDGMLLRDGTLEIRVVSGTLVFVKDDHRGVRIVVYPTF